MADEPKFFSVNRIDLASLLTQSTGPATVTRIRDRDKELQWKSIGSDDVTTELLQAEFKANGINFFQDVDFVAVLNHNLLSFHFEHIVGGVFITTPGTTVAAETESFTILPITNINTRGMKLVMDTTQVDDEEKKVGEILLLKRIFEMPDNEAPAEMGANFAPVVRATQMMDNGQVLNFLRWAGNRIDRYQTSLIFRFLPKADYDSIRAVLKEGVFKIQPEPTTRPDEFFRVSHARAGFPWGYTTPFKGSGYTITLDLEEV